MSGKEVEYLWNPPQDDSGSIASLSGNNSKTKRFQCLICCSRKFHPPYEIYTMLVNVKTLPEKRIQNYTSVYTKIGEGTCVFATLFVWEESDKQTDRQETPTKTKNNK